MYFYHANPPQSEESVVKVRVGKGWRARKRVGSFIEVRENKAAWIGGAAGCGRVELRSWFGSLVDAKRAKVIIEFYTFII
ncbi:hypothetical protein VB10N_41070 [Vibrio sp. 10N]|nr:hypothetical protein VB10N_41070 [Vibrio sp. 10N]